MAEGLFPLTIDDQIACVEREIRMRERVYPRWVGQGKMTQAKADHETAVMREALVTLRKVKPDGDGERLEQWLKLIRDRARGLAAVSAEFEVIAKWCDAALRGEKR